MPFYFPFWKKFCIFAILPFTFIKFLIFIIKRNMIKGEKHSLETRKKIGATMRKYYANETEEQRQIRIARLTERKRLEKQLYEKYLKDNKDLQSK